MPAPSVPPGAQALFESYRERNAPQHPRTPAPAFRRRPTQGPCNTHRRTTVDPLAEVDGNRLCIVNYLLDRLLTRNIRRSRVTVRVTAPAVPVGQRRRTGRCFSELSSGVLSRPAPPAGQLVRALLAGSSAGRQLFQGHRDVRRPFAVRKHDLRTHLPLPRQPFRFAQGKFEVMWANRPGG